LHTRVLQPEILLESTAAAMASSDSLSLQLRRLCVQHTLFLCNGTDCINILLQHRFITASNAQSSVNATQLIAAISPTHSATALAKPRHCGATHVTLWQLPQTTNQPPTNHLGKAVHAQARWCSSKADHTTTPHICCCSWRCHSPLLLLPHPCRNCSCCRPLGEHTLVQADAHCVPLSDGSIKSRLECPMRPQRLSDAPPPAGFGPQLQGLEPAYIIRVEKHQAHNCARLVHTDRVPYRRRRCKAALQKRQSHACSS
jgi:hypothetical protein